MTKKTKKKLNIPRPRPIKRRKGADERIKEAFANVPKITNETVAEHREDILRGARKFIYPLKHSRRKAIIISSSIFVAAIVVFMAYIGASLYRVQATDSFTYGVTKVMPFPVAKAGDSWVSYESYLFQLRRYIHYYTTQQEADFDGEEKAQLANYKQQALDGVINDAYVKQLADRNNVTVTDAAVDRQVNLVRSQNRLGASEQEFREVLNEFWDWDVSDFKRSLKQEMLAQAVVAKLDTETNTRARAALAQLRNGGDFAAIATQQSQDEASKANGGKYPAAIDPNNTDVAPAVVAELKKLQPGQYSDIVNTGYSLEIVRVDGVQDGKIQASRISFNFKPISDYIAPLKESNKPSKYISF
jgi:parvulin-like peptidyl-prolyl isomerase